MVGFALGGAQSFALEPAIVAWDTKLVGQVHDIDCMPLDRDALVGVDFLSFQRGFPSIPVARVDSEMDDFEMMHYS